MTQFHRHWVSLPLPKSLPLPTDFPALFSILFFARVFLLGAWKCGLEWLPRSRGP